MGYIPSPDECVELLRKSRCSEVVISHCKAVRDIAVRIARKSSADVELVEAGALLHDIGRSRTHGIFHAVEGARIAEKLGLPNDIINIIERHIGAGISREEAERIGLPSKEYIPQTLEEKIVCHADNLIEDNEQRIIEEEVKRALTDGHKGYAERLVKLHEELSEICGIDLNYI